jgi:hypothetical protein
VKLLRLESLCIASDSSAVEMNATSRRPRPRQTSWSTAFDSRARTGVRVLVSRFKLDADDRTAVRGSSRNPKEEPKGDSNE